MERIGDPDGVIEVRRQPSPERLGQIGGHDFDPGEPGRVGICGPSAQVNSGVALDHVDQPATFQIDKTGRVDRVMVPVGAQERCLIHTELADPPDPIRVIDERGAVLDHGVHDRLPTHPELVRYLRHRPSQLANSAARLGTGAAGQHDLGIQELERFGPRPRRTQRLAAPPPPLPDPQPGRPTEALQIADIDPHPILRLGPTPTPLDTTPRFGRLDLDRHLTVGFGHAGHAHTIEAVCPPL